MMSFQNTEEDAATGSILFFTLQKLKEISVKDKGKHYRNERNHLVFLVYL